MQLTPCRSNKKTGDETIRAVWLNFCTILLFFIKYMERAGLNPGGFTETELCVIFFDGTNDERVFHSVPITEYGVANAEARI